MKILLLAPPDAADLRGSAATVLRYRDGLQRRGHMCEVFGHSGPRQSLEGTIARFRPEVVHAHDAFHNGISLLGLRLPWVVTTSGDDVDEHMLDAASGPLVCEVMRRACRIIVPTSYEAAVIEERVAGAERRIDIVPRSANILPKGGTDLRRSLGISRNRLLVLLPGGLRPNKGQHRAMALLRVLRSRGIDSEMIVVGPDQDPLYASEIKNLAENETGVRVLPALSAERMSAAYRDADIVLNTSLSEGMSPVILEAGILGRPVVASDIPSNRVLVRHKETGLLYSDEESMAKAILAMIHNRSAAGALGVRMREDFKRRFDPEKEIDELLSAYAAAEARPGPVMRDSFA